jgi:hypothetical protein
MRIKMYFKMQKRTRYFQENAFLFSVKVRTLALDESLKANDVWQVGMDVIVSINM